MYLNKKHTQFIDIYAQCHYIFCLNNFEPFPKNEDLSKKSSLIFSSLNLALDVIEQFVIRKRIFSFIIKQQMRKLSLLGAYP